MATITSSVMMLYLGIEIVHFQTLWYQISPLKKMVVELN